MSTCPRCGTMFSCCMEDDGDRQHCWCMQLSPLSASDLASLAVTSDTNQCLCPDCLKTLAYPAPPQS